MEEYREKGYLPEALLNGLGLLGWNPPHREDPNVLHQGPNAVLKHEVMTLEDMEKLFNIEKVGKSGVKFDLQKLEYLNQMHVRNKFTYFEDPTEKKACVDEFRQLLLDTLDPRLHSKVRSTSDLKLCKIMDMMKQRIHFYDDLKNHTYFFE